MEVTVKSARQVYIQELKARIEEREAFLKMARLTKPVYEEKVGELNLWKRELEQLESPPMN